MNSKVKEAVDKLNMHLHREGDSEGLMLLNEVLRALLDEREKESNVLRKG